MATYKEIKGVTVQTLDSDPVVGGIPGATWASGGDLNTRRFGPAGGGVASSQTAAIAFGGDQMPTEPRMLGNTELYNGSSWTETADLNTDRGAQAVSAEFIDRMEELSKRLGLPQKLREVDIPKNACKKMAHDAMKQTRLLINNPREVKEADAFNIYQAAW